MHDTAEGDGVAVFASASSELTRAANETVSDGDVAAPLTGVVAQPVELDEGIVPFTDGRVSLRAAGRRVGWTRDVVKVWLP